MLFRESSHKNQNLGTVEDTSAVPEKLEDVRLWIEGLKDIKCLMIFTTYMIFLESPFTKDTTRFWSLQE